MWKSTQEAAVIRQRIIKAAAVPQEWNRWDGSLRSDGNRSVLRKNYCAALKHRE
jgi:hypothetical protein